MSDLPENRREIYCVNCGRDVVARLTSGAETYPHRPDLRNLPFWKCDQCLFHVGCHHKTEARTRPLGVIPSPAIRNIRKVIHQELDPLWKSGAISRSQVYKQLAKALNKPGYHTGEIRSEQEALAVLVEVRKIRQEVNLKNAG